MGHVFFNSEYTVTRPTETANTFSEKFPKTIRKGFLSKQNSKEDISSQLVSKQEIFNSKQSNKRIHFQRCMSISRNRNSIFRTSLPRNNSYDKLKITRPTTSVAEPESFRISSEKFRKVLYCLSTETKKHNQEQENSKDASLYFKYTGNKHNFLTETEIHQIYEESRRVPISRKFLMFKNTEKIFQRKLQNCTGHQVDRSKLEMPPKKEWNELCNTKLTSSDSISSSLISLSALFYISERRSTKNRFLLAWLRI